MGDVKRLTEAQKKERKDERDSIKRFGEGMSCLAMMSYVNLRICSWSRKIILSDADWLKIEEFAFRIYITARNRNIKK